MSAGLEVADALRRHGDAYRRAHDGHLGRVERRVMSAIALCRTAALGGHTEACAECGLVRCAYNSCRNRHCPKCQGQARAEWLAARQAELLPVPYFHVVFTLPAPVAEIAFQNKATVYAILFRTAAETLRTIAADPRHPGAEISVQPMALRDSGVTYDQLHHLVGNRVCDAVPLKAALLAEADKMVGGDDAWLIVDDTALPKKGRRSVGVAPQYASAFGKNANCQTVVSIILVSREVPVMVGLKLFLPES